MCWIYFSILLICILYFVLVLVFFIGWNRIQVFVPKGDELIRTKISVIVVCRNEEDNVRQIFSCMAQQSYQNYELIVVNDHSEDATKNYIKAAQLAYPKIQLIDAIGVGKKNGLKEGIQYATGELIITTDADCLPSFHWVESIACFYMKYHCDLIICPVKLSGKENLFTNLQDLEFTSLIASGAGASGAGMPVLCNGANLAFTKKSWLKSQVDLHEEEISGDDMFLMESIKKNGGRIRFLKSETAFVFTKPSETLVDFINQRRRWTSKSSAYTDWQVIVTAGLVFSTNLGLMVLLSLSFYSPVPLLLFLTLFFLKYGVDSLFLYSVNSFFQFRNLWIYSFLLSIVYPFYIVLIPVSSFFVKSVKWK
jgi:biofilm PGA synthesis N-glycosyltransferase PgaC